MAIDIVARGLALSLLNDQGKLASELMPEVQNGEVTQYAVGGIPAGMSLDGKTLEEILMLMLFGVVNPTLTNPYLKVTGDPLIGVVGRPLEVKGEIYFDRGKITPANGTSGFRAGLPSFYTVGDETIITQETTVNFSYQFDKIEKGSNTLQFYVNYEEGEQPYDSQGKEFDGPLPAGRLAQVLEIYGYYPVYSGIEDHNELDLISAYFNDNGEGYQVKSQAETNYGEKWSVAFHSDLSIVGIQQYDILSHSWQWLGGSPDASLSYFNIDLVTKEVDGVVETYTSYSNALDLVGERELKFYTVLPEVF